MTVQEILDRNKVRKKMQTGGQVGVTTINPAGQDLAQKTIRDTAPPVNATSPTLPGASKIDTPKTATGILGSKENPMYMVQSEGQADNRAGKTGMLAGMKAGKDRFGMVGAIAGGALGLLGGLKRRGIDKNAAPAANKGTKLVPKAQGGGSADAGLQQLKLSNNLNPIKPVATPSLNYLQNNPQANQVQAYSGTLPNQSQPKSGFGGGMASSAGDIANLAGDTLEALKPKGPMNTWGIETQTKKGNNMAVAGSAAKGAAKGFSAGMATGNIFVAAGLGIAGGVAGFFSGKKKVKQEAKEIKDQTQLAYEGYNQKANAAQYAALGKCGAKLSIMHKVKSSKKDKISMKNRKFKSGGKLNSLGETNIIPSGTLHKETNNLGQKDKGIPIVDKEGKKKFEVEREELIIRLKTTKAVEDFVAKYKRSHNNSHLVNLGKLLADEINNNTHDFSGKYGLEVQ